MDWMTRSKGAESKLPVDHRKPSWRGMACVFALPALLIVASNAGTATAPLTRAGLDQRFASTVRPFLQSYCNGCHGKQSPAAQLDLSAYGGLKSVLESYPHWSLVQEKIDAKQMPPATASKQPTDKQREAVIAWIRDARQYLALQNAGDPGPVLARRLSNAEYDYTIRDLTGVDLHPTREFPVDPANQEGFDNSGESLTISSALMKKYVQAAKEISDHLALTSTGIAFAAHPVLAETDRDKFCIFRIVDFYKRQPTDYANYFHAAWRYRHRVALGMPNATLRSVAEQEKVSPRYLQLVWDTLNTTADTVGPMAKLQSLWNALPAPDKDHPDPALYGCIALRDWVQSLRKKTAWKFNNLRVPGGFSTGGQCFVLYKDRQYATHRRLLNPATLQIGGIPATHTIPARRNKPEQVLIDPIDPDLFVPQDQTERTAYIAAFNRFCDVFPDAFYIAERGRMFVDEPGDQGRLLTAGLHNSMGYFRDDAPLMDLILDGEQRWELDHLWQDFDMVAFIPERMHLEFFVYERAESGTITDPEFNFARAEDKDALSDEKIKRLADLYLAKAQRLGAEPVTLAAISDHFQRVSTNIRSTEKARLEAEPLHRQALLDFARRAYRRPLTDSERADLLNFYFARRKEDGLTHEEAIRDAVIRILMSYNFLFRLDSGVAGSGLRTAALKSPPTASTRGNFAVQPLSDYALASRLSYFLWSSMPDNELLWHAAQGDLHRPEVLKAQTRRMLKDDRVQALAVEFVGNWLDFRRFEEHNAVDRDRFPRFTNELREAMYEEPVHFLTDTIQGNRSALEMLYGKYTFVNRTLAQHYGMSDLTIPDNQWVRVENADRYGRGGLLPMAVFLTKNSPGLRTSPVKRGYWVVRRLLGESIPPPPPVVPELPKDETKLGDLTLRQALEQHRKNPACAGCHARFDSYGLVFEGYGPIGERRTVDLGGKSVDIRAPFPGGDRLGVGGLQEFVRQQRQQDFLSTLNRKLLSYALGRSLQPSDDLLLREMAQRSAAEGYRLPSLVETIVTSRPFLYRRAPITVARSE